MKKTAFLSVLVAAILAIALCATPQVVPQTPVNPSGFVVRRGINLCHLFAGVTSWARRGEYITENDIRFIRHCGFDHVRLPVNEKELWRDDGTPEEEQFTYLRTVIDWCLANRLRVIVDMHVLRAHNFNAENMPGVRNTLWNDAAAQAHFVALWEELSRRLCDYPVDKVAYELLNEPTADNPEDWNKLLKTGLGAIRSREPGRVVVIGSNRWQSPASFRQLRIPEDDKNIILSFHFYAPLALTHHKAGWIGEPLRSYDGPVGYPGPVVSRDALAQFATKNADAGKMKIYCEDWDAKRLRQEILPAIRRAKDLGLQLYCGEFGCLDTVPHHARLAYLHDLISIFDSEGIAWAHWQYKGLFGIYEWHLSGDKIFVGAPDVALIDILMGQTDEK
jgi:endoglucanase